MASTRQGGGCIGKGGTRAAATWSTGHWRRLGQGFPDELKVALEAVLARIEGGKADGPDAALLHILAAYELELQRVLARLAWLEQDAAPAPRAAPRYTLPLAAVRWSGHAAEDPIEEEPEAEAAW